MPEGKNKINYGTNLRNVTTTAISLSPQKKKCLQTLFLHNVVIVDLAKKTFQKIKQNEEKCRNLKVKKCPFMKTLICSTYI